MISDCLQELYSNIIQYTYGAKYIKLFFNKEKEPQVIHLFKFIISKIFEGRDFMNGYDLIISSELPIKGETHCNC